MLIGSLICLDIIQNMTCLQVEQSFHFFSLGNKETSFLSPAFDLSHFDWINDIPETTHFLISLLNGEITLPQIKAPESIFTSNNYNNFYILTCNNEKVAICYNNNAALESYQANVVKNYSESDFFSSITNGHLTFLVNNKYFKEPARVKSARNI